MEYQSVFQRYEKKYLMAADQCEALERKLAGRLSPDRYGRHTICNLYYDTEDFALIRASIEKPRYKEKLRLRSYGVPGRNSAVFAEIKKKYKGVVYKRREELPLWQAENLLDHGIFPEDQSQILQEIEWFLRCWRPRAQVFLAYDRVALSGGQDPGLRVTFDRNIRWRTEDLNLSQGDWGAALLPPGLVLMEIKIPGAMPVWLAHTLSELNIFPTSFSKYGTCYQKYLLARRFAAVPAARLQNGGVISA